MLVNSTQYSSENHTRSTSYNLTEGNQTVLDVGPHWTTATYLSLTVEVCSLLINGSLVFLFAWNRSLLTAFTVYVLNLCIANIFSTLFFNSLHLIDYLYAPLDMEGTNWWLGDSWCTMYQYSDWLLAGTMCNAHALIALNRFWAVTFPNWYRLKQTKMSAFIICATKWLYMHLCVLPGILVDVYVYRPPAIRNVECHVSTDSPLEWQTIMQLLLFDAPLVVIFGVLPVVYYKMSQRLRRNVQPSVLVTSGTSGGTQATQPTGLSNSLPPTVNQPIPAPPPPRAKSSGILALTLMTATVLVCYFPDNLYNTLWMFNIDLGKQFYQVVTVMYELTPVFDPIWFILTLPKLRHAYFHTFFSL